MKRPNTLASLIGVLITAIFLSVLALVTWRSGGKAFSPGPLTSQSSTQVIREGFTSHAEMEGQCDRCHQPLETTQGPLCLGCHIEVKTQIELQTGTHSLLDKVTDCARCHSDHQGRQFDAVQDAFDQFDHQRTHFSLSVHAVDYRARPLECTACHQFEAGFSVLTTSCIQCHGAQQPVFMQEHISTFGTACQACHDGRDTMALFEHSQTLFPLQGKHAQVSCRDRHKGIHPENADQVPAVFKEAPEKCAGCHREPEAHAGMFSDDCASCHTESGWSPAVLAGTHFNHQSQGGFSLAHHHQDYQERAINCATCHPSGTETFDLHTCTDCHSQGEERASFMRQHQEQFGAACLDCHDGVDRLSDFEHNNFFSLEGRHGQIECQECHQNHRFRGTPVECVQCHAEPSIHAGFFGQRCLYCHTAGGWTPAYLRLHRFPLEHGRQDVQECTLCHTTIYDVYTCYGCHEHQPEAVLAAHTSAGITQIELSECALCHPDGSHPNGR